MTLFKLSFAALVAFALVPGSIANMAFAEKQVVGYVFMKDAVLKPGQIDAHAMTRINYAFANIQNGRIVEGSKADAANYAYLTNLRKQNPSLTILVSVGGWVWSGGFSDVALTPQSRAVFIDSVMEFLHRYDLDGLDIDWEYPGLAGAGHAFRAEDKQNFTSLLAELRHRFQHDGRGRKRPLLLTIAAGASSSYLDHTEMSKAQKYLDTVNLMSYDYYFPSGNNLTGHHAPLYTNAADPQKISADASVKAFVRAGVPARKLLLGVPFYGHAWSAVPDTAHGLYQPGSANVKGYASYQDLKTLLQGAGYVRYWDAIAKVPYLYNEEQQIFISYDDPESLRGKAQYILDHHLAGVMFWSYESDASGELLRTLNQVLRPALPQGKMQ